MSDGSRGFFTALRKTVCLSRFDSGLIHQSFPNVEKTKFFENLKI
jgi:hypothetical protein